MSIIEWILVGAVLFIFIVILFYAGVDLIRDRKYYVAKSKNLTKIEEHKKRKKKR